MFQNLVFRQGDARNFSRMESALKRGNSNELDDASGLKFSGKPTKHETKF